MRGWKLWIAVAGGFALALESGCSLGQCNGSDAAPPPESPAPPPAEESVLRGLTGTEYDHTVRDLLGDTAQPGRFFPQGDTSSGFESAPAVSSLTMEFLLVAAEQVAMDALTRLPQLLPCDPTTIMDDTCPKQFIASLARRAYRRAVTADDLTPLYALYSTAKGDGGVNAGLQTVIEAILISPDFLYLREDNAAQASQGEPLTAYELAARLSYALWNTTPDATLSAAADSGQLTTSTIGDHARRLLADPQAKEAVISFFTQWLALDSLDSLTRDIFFGKPNFPVSMRTETQLFASHVFFEDGGKLQTLLTAPYAFADFREALLYGLNPPPENAGFVKMDLPAGRVGLLTQPSFLTIHAAPDRTSPTQRGKFVREQLLCQIMPAPPPNVLQNFDVPVATTTMRELVRKHMENKSCAACHQLMDPIGLGFEGFDNQGSAATGPVDTSGTLTGTDIDGNFNGPVELAQRLAGSQQVRDCMTRQWFRFLLRRGEQAADQPSIAAAGGTLNTADGDLREMVIALTQSDAFTHHHAPAGSTP
jgi:hypothetical protein